MKCRIENTADRARPAGDGFPGVVIVEAALPDMLRDMLPATLPGARPGAHGAAERAVAVLAGVAASDVRIVSRCRHCGAPHGALVVVAPGSRHGPIFVNLSRAAGTVVAAATLAGPIGIDIESEERMSRASVDSVAFHPRELTSLVRLPEATRNRERTRLWTQKEALLKATGHGLRVPPAEVWLAGVGAGGRSGRSAKTVYVRDAPSVIRTEVEAARFFDLRTTVPEASLPDRCVGTICVLPA